MVRLTVNPLTFRKNLREGKLNKTFNLSDRNNVRDLSNGLVPIGDTGLYVTPDTPASPTDCDRWPDSPFCGKNPFSKKIVDIAPEIAIDNCNIAITLKPTLAFIKLPIFRLTYRFPGQCREFPPLPPFVLPPTGEYSIRGNLPINRCSSTEFGGRGNIIIALAALIRRQEQGYDAETNSFSELDQKTMTQLVNFDFPVTGTEYIPYQQFTSSGYVTVQALVFAKITIKFIFDIKYNQVWKDAWRYYLPDEPSGLYHFHYEHTQIFKLTDYTFSTTSIAPNDSKFSGNFDAGGTFWVNELERVTRLLQNNGSGGYRKINYSEDGYGDYGTNTLEVVNSFAIKCWPGNVPKTIFPSSPPPIRKPPPPPLMPPVTTCCSCAQISAIVKARLKELKQIVTVPVISCELVNGTWTPINTPTTITFFSLDASTVASQAGVYIELANQAISLCELKNQESIAAVPEWWQLRPEGKRPQLVVQCGAVKSDGKVGRAEYPVTIPHYQNYGKALHSPVPPYIKGNWEGILTLSDNSKLIVNCISEAECDRVIESIKPFIIPEMLVGSTQKNGVRKNQPIIEQLVVAKYAKYFPLGLRSLNPEWIAYF